MWSEGKKKDVDVEMMFPFQCSFVFILKDFLRKCVCLHLQDGIGYCKGRINQQ